MKCKWRFQWLDCTKKYVYSRTIDDNKIMKPLQRKQMCTERTYDAQVFGNDSNSHSMNSPIFQTPCPCALNSFACTNIFYMLFDSLLEIISSLIPCSWNAFPYVCTLNLNCTFRWQNDKKNQLCVRESECVLLPLWFEHVWNAHIKY